MSLAAYRLALKETEELLRDIIRVTRKRVAPDALFILLLLRKELLDEESWEDFLKSLRDSTVQVESNTITIEILKLILERFSRISEKQSKASKPYARENNLPKKQGRKVIQKVVTSNKKKPQLESLIKKSIEEYLLEDKDIKEVPEEKKHRKSEVKERKQQLEISIREEKEDNFSEKLHQKLEKKIQADISEKERTVLQIEVIKVPEKIVVEDSAEIFRQYFEDRYHKIKEILLKRNYGVQRNYKLNGIEKTRRSTYVIILVKEKRYDRKKNIGIIIGDTPEKEIKVIVPLENELRTKFNYVLLDTVIAIEGKTRDNRKYLIAEDIIFPETPILRERNRAPFPTKVAFISDIHVGSAKFLREEFLSFINFLNQRVEDDELKRLAKDVKYVIINGDLVDGIGVYPEQKSELEIVDIYKQYEEASKFLELIPKDKTIVIIPGNHDAAGKFVPQPPISEKIAEGLYSLPNVKILGNPAWIRINGVKILLYHGYGIEHIAADLELSIQEPTRILVELLRNRHLMPIWGKIPIIPTKEDYLVIDDVPDILAIGHLHIADIRISRGGVVLLSSGSFQGLTIWQRQLGIKPTPGIVPVIDLNTYEINVLKCEKGNCYQIQ
ncbi:MAG: metallophosphoesterase [Candidatus Njordarchaeales archaeon]